MRVDSELSSRAVSSLLLDLHERAHELGYREFQRFCIRRVATLIPHDAWLFGVGTIQHGVPRGHDILLEGRPQELMDSWETVKHEDIVALTALTNPNRTHRFDIDEPRFDDVPSLAAHCRTWRIQHVLCTAVIDQASGLYWVVSLYRERKDEPFTEDERATTELLAPHIIVATRHARLRQLRAATYVHTDVGHSAAVVNDDGLVLEAEPDLIAMLQQQHPSWTGPVLPREVWAAMREEPDRPHMVKSLVLTLSRAQDVWLLQARRVVAADQLTAREREVARAFSQGDTYREIGERLGIAPNTVRRHLANIYEKLGISSKAELDRMVSDR